MAATLEEILDDVSPYGAVKLKDGVFFGDYTAANDVDFIIANKVAGIINCCGREVANHFQSLGVEYLTYNWVDNESQIILDIRNIVITEVMELIDQCLELGESVLIHSFRGRSRCITLLAAYLIRKYSWSLNKALEFIQSRRGDVRMKPVFHRQLVSFERRLSMSGIVLSHGWDNAPRFSSTNDELILFNTFMNSRFGKNKRLADSIAPRRENESLRNQRIEWRDHFTDDRSKLEQLSNSTGNMYLGKNCMSVKSILKKPEMYRKFDSPSAATTAATTPEQTAYRPSTPLRRGYEVSPGTRPASPLPLRGPGPPSISLNRANVLSSLNSQASRINSGLCSFGNVSSGPVRVGRTTTPTNSPSVSTANFPSRISNHYVRPPSPMVSHSGRTAVRPPSPAPSQRSQIRPPSPARIPPNSGGGLSLNNEIPSNVRPTVPPPAVKSMVSASGYRRSQSPMVASLPGVRNNSWRTR